MSEGKVSSPAAATAGDGGSAGSWLIQPLDDKRNIRVEVYNNVVPGDHVAEADKTRVITVKQGANSSFVLNIGA